MVECGVCRRSYKNDNSLNVHASLTHRGTPSRTFAPHRYVQKPAPAPEPQRKVEPVAESRDGHCGSYVTCATALPKGYTGKYWTTRGPIFTTLYHFYE